MLKTIHLVTVGITLALFFYRGSLIYISKKDFNNKFLKITPHINDTVLLTTGIWMAINIQQYPLVHHWLTAKVVGLLAYIILGMFAMKWFRGTGKGLIAWVLAILVFIYIISAAHYHDALGLLRFFS